jgi:hypothetical protein
MTFRTFPGLRFVVSYVQKLQQALGAQNGVDSKIGGSLAKFGYHSGCNSLVRHHDHQTSLA